MADLPIDDLNVASNETLITPAQLKREIPLTDAALRTVASGREVIRNILDGKDHRLFVVVGPCSIHDIKAAHEYAERLKALAAEVSDSLYLVMRVYFEKPRTTVGWKGLINDPYLDDSFKIQDGLHIGRQLLLDLAEKADLAAKREAMFSGAQINDTEGRAVLHTALRNLSGAVIVEGRDVMSDNVDVVVTDGFTGNVVLKTLEGGMKTLIKALMAAFAAKEEYKPHADALFPALLPLYESVDPESTGGAILLGVDGVCIISHGSSSARAMVNGIKVASDMVQCGIVEEIRRAINGV